MSEHDAAATAPAEAQAGAAQQDDPGAAGADEAAVDAGTAEELERLKQQGAQNTERWAQMRLAQRWLHRDEQKIPAEFKASIAQACDQSPALAKLVAMREELRQLWTRTNVSAEQLVHDLQAWCRQAEESGIAELQAFSLKLRMARV